MVTPDQPQSDDRSSAIVWRLRDKETLERELEGIFGNASGRQPWMDSVLGSFSRELNAHPLEWPIAERLPSEHTWRFFGVEIRYRIIPADQTVEVLSVSALRPRDPHLRGTPTI